MTELIVFRILGEENQRCRIRLSRLGVAIKQVIFVRESSQCKDICKDIFSSNSHRDDCYELPEELCETI